MADARRTGSAARGRGRGGGPGAIQLNLAQPAAFTAGALQQQQQQQQQQQSASASFHGSGNPPPAGGPGTGNNQTLVGQPYVNTAAMLGVAQPTMVPARPSSEQQQAQNAQRVQQQLEALGVAALIAPDGRDETPQDHLRNYGFAPEDGPLDGQLPSFIPKRGLLRCFVQRHREGVISTNVKYTLMVEKGPTFVLAGRKRANKSTSNYLMSRSVDDMERQSAHFHGKVRANFAGTEFVIYDDGENPEKGKNGARVELGAILYETNIAGTRGPRRMTVVLPRRSEDGTVEKWQPTNDKESIVAEYRADPTSERLIVLTNKDPSWNEQLRSYQLNFHGRVSQASVKNFQLVDAKQPSRLVMQFGKNTSDKFSLDYQSPLSATQAFAIALTSFDNKLACE